MMNSDAALYTAFKAKDARFDGRFFVGVLSTGIYCRPVCRARKPKRQNCTFYSTAAEAEAAGYRPCLLCRPELAPGASIHDAKADLAFRAARLLERNCGNRQSLSQLAGRLGCTDRHLRRVFAEEYNVTLIQYLQTCRLLLAKTLLTDTALSILSIAMASGFGSLRRFNDVFKKQYNMSPTELRGHFSNSKKHGTDLTLALSYRPPYLWQPMLHFFQERAIDGVEMVDDGAYFRTVNMVNADGEHAYGWVRVAHKPEKNALAVTISDSLLSVVPQVVGRIRHQFDLYCQPDIIYETLSTMNKVRPGLCTPGTRVPGCFSSFEIAVRAVLGQQITVKSARTLAARVVAAYGRPVETPIRGLTHTFPTPEAIVAMGDAVQENFGGLGVTSARSLTIRRLAGALVRKELHLDMGNNPEAEMAKLMAIRGIGCWTAQYIAMRAMDWPDAFLDTDAGVKKALQPRTSKEMLRLAEKWRPWRSYATINLWNSL